MSRRDCNATGATCVSSHVTLKPTEQALVTAAANIYSGSIAGGRVPAGEETKWLKQSIRDAVQIAKLTDQAVIADGEFA